jgi:hypothetical protein
MKFLQNIYDWLQKNLRPPSAFSWETLILLSLFSLYMAFLATEWVAQLLIEFAWIFLIFGVFWGTTSANQFRVGYKSPVEPGFPLSPWITGALVSIYIFSRNGELTQETLVSWPIVSAIIAALPDFVGEGPRLKIPPPQKRQNLVILFGTQFLLSCWFQFYFVIQNWLGEYPSLLADDFQQSAFVVKRELATSTIPRGALLLNTIEPKLFERLDGKPWPEVERLLLQDQRVKLISAVEKEAKQQISPKIAEDAHWIVNSAISSRNSGYNLDLRAIWQGPRAELQNQEKYYVTKLCQITPSSVAATPTANPTTPQPAPAAIGTFACEQGVRGWGIDDDEPSAPRNSFIRQ